MVVIRQTEIHQRRVRKLKLKKLRGRYKEAKNASEKQKIVEKLTRLAPWISEEEFVAASKGK